MVMELNDKQAIQELVTNQIAMYTIEMEKRELERLRSLQVEKNYDYIQAGLEGIWSYMTPVSVYVYNSVTGMQNNINTVLNLQKQQAQLLQENENIQLSIFRINNDIEFKTKAVLKSLNETSKRVQWFKTW
jgi:virulence-associated protein VapD